MEIIPEATTGTIQGTTAERMLAEGILQQYSSDPICPIHPAFSAKMLGDAVKDFPHLIWTTLNTKTPFTEVTNMWKCSGGQTRVSTLSVPCHMACGQG